MSTACFQTRIRNTSGRSLTVNFLRRGKRLAAEEEISIDGNAMDFVVQRGRRREIDAFKAMLAAMDLTIMSSPAEIHYDATLAMPKVIDVVNGSTHVTDPCVGQYSSSMS